jgi:magnesium-transporting ATPase (P-type)
MKRNTSFEKLWHTFEMDEVLASLQTDEEGLSEAEAKGRLEKSGPNQLPREPVPGIFTILLRQFKSPLIYILGIAALVSVAIGEMTDAAFIGAVLVINAIIGGYQEWRAEKSSRALEKFLKIRASVYRDGEPKEIDAEELVPGDIVWLESGHRVPADLRLLMSHDLQVDESPLTGESLPVLKDTLWKGDPFSQIGDRLNMAHAGTTVVRGRGKGVVVGTGVNTIIGQLALDVMSTKGGKPPLILRLEKFTRVVGFAVVFSVFFIALFGLTQEYKIGEMFFFAVALAVSAIPEGLPVAVTVALAIGSNRMARRGVIVRQLAAVEGLGSCTIIASDKTGTLTCNELTVREVRSSKRDSFKITGEGFAPTGQILKDEKPVELDQYPELSNLFRAAILCNEADLRKRDGDWVWKGDPTDVALLSLGQKVGWTRASLLNQYPQINEIPFESEHQFAATYHSENDEALIFVKGAPERVLAMCQTAGDEK